GTRTRLDNFEVDDFKYGTFKIAMNSKKPIIPVALSGTWRIFNNKTKMKYYPIQFSFLKPITYEEYKDMTSMELAKYVEQLVREEHKRLRDLEPQLIKELNPKLKKVM
ncbi:MAG: lysophospholipid acyltransferase family protein, partial [Traorella sp.]